MSPHPCSELCSAYFDKYLPWSLGLYNPYIHLDIHLNSPGSIQPLTRNLAPWLTYLPSKVPICSWVERSNAAWSALLRGTTSGRTGMVLNPGLDLDPNPASCTVPLDQLAATCTIKTVTIELGSILRFLFFLHNTEAINFYQIWFQQLCGHFRWQVITPLLWLSNLYHCNFSRSFSVLVSKAFYRQGLWNELLAI